MPADVRIDVVNLIPFQKALKQVDVTLPRQLRVINLKAATLAADRTRAAFASGPGVAPKVAPTVKALAQQRSASVRIGGNAGVDRAALGAEFGGGAHGAGNPTSLGGYTSQFRPWKGNGADAGYFLYPTLSAMQDEIVELYGGLIDDVAAAAFPD